MFTVSGFGAAKKPVVKKKTTPAAGAVKPTAASKAYLLAAAKRLQAALLLLGKIAGSPSLSAIKVDGAPGAKTIAAVNLTFTKHLGPGQAPAQYRTGKLPADYIKNNANELAALIEAEIKRRGGTPVASGLVTKAALTKAIKSNPAPIPATASKEVAKRLQLSLVTLGKQTGSAQLKAVKVDGALGPATAAAVNWAFTKHIGSGQAPAQYRTGKLPLDYIKGNATVLATMIESEVKRRGGKVVTKIVGTAKKVKTKSGTTVTAIKVDTESGETYQVTNAKGETYYTTDPTAAEPPSPPDGLPEPSEEQHAVAAEASAAAATATRKPVVSPKQVPSRVAAEAADEAEEAVSTALAPTRTAAMLPSNDGGGESFFSEYKWPIIGGVAAIAAIGVGVIVMKKRQAQKAGR